MATSDQLTEPAELLGLPRTAGLPVGWRAALPLLLLGLTACSCNDPHGRPTSPQPSRTSLAAASAEAVVLAEAGRAHVVIVAPERLFQPPATVTPAPSPSIVPSAAAAFNGDQENHLKAPRPPKPRRLTREEQATLAESKRLLAAVEDLAKYLSRLAGTEIPIVHGAAPAGTVPILIGERAADRFGPVGIQVYGKQGLRYVVSHAAIGLYGESDLATGYAIYELLDRLGCRWFMPGELGEEIPPPGRVALAATDEKLAPSTLYRGLRFADEDYKRRNRLGGVIVAAGHKLEAWLSAEQREEHPDWRAEIRGKPDSKRLRWSKPEVADAIAESIEAQLQRRPAPSISISPLDGAEFDDSVDRGVDAGDWDPAMGRVSLTDRLLVLGNRIAARLAPKYPELTLGLLAYSSYTRPPVREKVHPSIVPVLAPITYCRAHAWSDDACPGAKEARQAVEGWASRVERLAYRGYAFNLAEPAAPNPMLRKWSWELPYLLSHKVQFFQPETMANFETSLPALWLGVRLSWDRRRAPNQVLSELFERFYGHAAVATQRYVDLIDRAWADAPVYAGGELGYARRFPPELMKQAREALDNAKAACQTETERQRVELLNASLTQLESYLKLALDFRTGHLGALDQGLKAWLDKSSELGERYASNSAFGKMQGAYAQRFLKAAYQEADRIAREQVVLTRVPTCAARYRVLPKLRLPVSAVPTGDPQDASYDFCVDTWSSLGKHDYFGAMLYSWQLHLPQPVPGKHTFLWLSKVDGIAQVWINGKLARPVGASVDAPATAEAHLQPMTFDITDAATPGPDNQVTVVVQRTVLAELGAGGLLGPVYAYRDR